MKQSVLKLSPSKSSGRRIKSGGLQLQVKDGLIWGVASFNHLSLAWRKHQNSTYHDFDAISVTARGFKIKVLLKIKDTVGEKK